MPAAAQPETVFDLIARSDAIVAPWWFLAIFMVAGVVIASLAFASWRLGWSRDRRMALTPFALIWWAFTLYAAWSEIDFANTTRAAVRQGTYRVVEGCLTRFHPGAPYASKSSVDDEVWTLGGERFSYGAGRVGFYWHQVEPLGGAVHADSRVRVAFVPNSADGGNAILRLAVTQHACPRAPDAGAAD